MSKLNNKHSRPFIFIHVPKTGGSSMESLGVISSSGHGNLYWFCNNHKNLDNFFKWCFIRNPFDRIASSYYYIKSTTRKHNDTEKKLVSKYTDFESFVMGGLDEFLPVNIHPSEPAYKLIQHILPLKYFIECDGCEMDFIGKFENLKEDWGIVMNELGLNYKLPHENRTEKRPESNYIDLYNEDMKKVILNKYEDEFVYYPELIG